MRLESGFGSVDIECMNDPSQHTPTEPTVEPLSRQHYDAMRDAKSKRAKIDFAIGVATFNGWSIGIFAVISALILPLSFSLQGLLVAAGLGAVAYHEFKGRRLLHLLDTRAPRLLGYNQLALGAVIVGYCAWSLIAELAGPGSYAQTIEQNPELADVLGSMEGLMSTIVVAVYVGAILLTIPYQGLIAWYYFSREKHLRAYIDQTPGWVTDLQRAAA